MDQAFSKKLIYLPLHFLGFLGVHSVGRLGWEGGTGDEVYFMLYGSFGREAMGNLTREDMFKIFEERGKKRMGRILSFDRFLAK